MRTAVITVVIGIGGIAAGFAFGREPRQTVVQAPPMPMNPWGTPGMPPPGMMAMMKPLMEHSGEAALAIGAGGAVYVLRGETIYRYSPDLRLLGQVELPAVVKNSTAAKALQPAQRAHPSQQR